MENEYGVSPLMMLRVFWPLTIILPVVMTLIVTGPLVLYPIARWRANKEKHVDPQLGIKFALGYFGLMAFQILLFGVMFVLYTMLSKASSDDKGALYRFGFGFIVPAAIVMSAHVVALRRTNELQFPNVRRLFLGYNLVITGLLGFISLIFAFQALFAKGSTDDGGRVAAAAVLVYGAAWAACGVQFGRFVMGGYSVPPTDDIVPPSPPTSQPPMPGGPALPPLGGGAYPPIEPR